MECAAQPHAASERSSPLRLLRWPRRADDGLGQIGHHLNDAREHRQFAVAGQIVMAVALRARRDIAIGGRSGKALISASFRPKPMSWRAARQRARYAEIVAGGLDCGNDRAGESIRVPSQSNTISSKRFKLAPFAKEQILAAAEPREEVAQFRRQSRLERNLKRRQRMLKDNRPACRNMRFRPAFCRFL